MFHERTGLMKKVRLFFESGGEGTRHHLLSVWFHDKEYNQTNSLLVQNILQELKVWYTKRGQTLGGYKPEDSRLLVYKLFNDEEKEQLLADKYVADVLAANTKATKRKLKNSKPRYVKSAYARVTIFEELQRQTKLLADFLGSVAKEERKLLKGQNE